LFLQGFRWLEGGGNDIYLWPLGDCFQIACIELSNMHAPPVLHEVLR